MTIIKMIKKEISHPDGAFIYGLSDLHVGSKEFNENEFKKFTQSILKEDNRYCVIVGDVIDNGTKNSVTGPYEATMSPREQREYAAELLMPIRDRILCMVAGNHERRSTKDTDTDPAELIAERLDIWELYRENMVFLSLKIGKRSTNSVRPPNYCICVSHGTSGGQLIGAGLNRADQFAIASGADLVVMGHSHKPAVAPAARLECLHRQGVMVQRKYAIMICTAWLDYGGYPMQTAYKPLPISPNRVWLEANQFGMELMQTV